MERKYKWELRKGSRKEICPSCGRKTFVPYVLASDGKTLAGAEYGRCDRENNCRYFRYPNGVERESAGVVVERKEEKPLRVKNWAVAETMGKTNLFDYLCSFLSKEKVAEVWEKYKVGSYCGETVFWQIDRANEVRSGKIIPYGKDGHRRKDVKFPAMWFHSLKSKKELCIGEKLEQCFFGEHLLTEGASVAIVESEKTALALAVQMPEHIWLASGGSNGLSEKKCEVLKSCRVILYPDNGMYFKWRAVALRNGWEISNCCEKNLSKYGLKEGYDILDVLEYLKFNGFK